MHSLLTKCGVLITNYSHVLPPQRACSSKKGLNKNEQATEIIPFSAPQAQQSLTTQGSRIATTS